MEALSVCVRSYHLDGYGHVNNARYLEFLEEARWTFFDTHGLSVFLHDLQMVVSRIDIRYRRSAGEGSCLDIETQVSSVRPRQVVLCQQIYLRGSRKTSVEAEVTLMPVQQGKAVSLPDGLLQALVGLMADESSKEVE